MGKIIDSPLSDKELEEMGVEISETETDAVFFEWMKNMIDNVFKDVPKG